MRNANASNNEGVVWNIGKLFVGDGYESIHNFQFNAILLFFTFFLFLSKSACFIAVVVVLSIYIELFFFRFRYRYIYIYVYVFSVWFFPRISFLRYFCSPLSLSLSVSLYFICLEIYLESLVALRYLHNAYKGDSAFNADGHVKRKNHTLKDAHTTMYMPDMK